MNERKAGVLLSVSSLPGEYGVGDFGKSAFAFIDIIANMGFSFWQILPLNPLGFGNSPYQPYSSFAIDEVYLDVDSLFKDYFFEGKPEACPACERVDYQGARELKLRCLKAACPSFSCKELVDFEKKNKWAREYALFKAIKKLASKGWNEFPDGFDKGYKEIDRDSPYYDEYKFELFIQMVLFKQWKGVLAYAHSKKIEIIGDIPFYVGYDSSDVWANQKCFLLDKKHNPSFIAGVPPDYFSKTGQRWGNPIYDFAYLEKHGFKFLCDRIAYSASLYDIIRIDHFRAFDTYWKIPASCPTAIDGEWVIAPGYAFFDTLFAKYPELKEKIIAEDLGLMRDEVYVLRDHYAFPGMDVVQFTFHMFELDHQGDFGKENLVTYLGTHDNEPILGAFYKMNDIEQALWVEKLSKMGFDKGNMVDRLSEYAFSKPSKYVILSMQDLLGLDGDSRTNTPGEVNPNNWTWKLKDFKDLMENEGRIVAMLKKAGRYND